MNKKILIKLISLANRMDKARFYKEASELDEISEGITTSKSQLTLEELRVVLEALEDAANNINPKSEAQKLLRSAFEKIQSMPTI